MMIIQLARPDFFYSLNSLSLPDNEVSPPVSYISFFSQQTSYFFINSFFYSHVTCSQFCSGMHVIPIYSQMTSPTPRYLYLFTVQGQANHLMVIDCYRPWKPSIQETSACTRTNSSSIRHLVDLYHLSPWLIQVQVSQGKNIVLVYSNIQLLLTNISSKT